MKPTLLLSRVLGLRRVVVQDDQVLGVERALLRLGRGLAIDIEQAKRVLGSVRVEVAIRLFSLA